MNFFFFFKNNRTCLEQFLADNGFGSPLYLLTANQWTTTTATLRPSFTAAFADFGEHFIIATPLRASTFHSFYWKKKYMRSTDLLWGYDSDFFDILHTQPHDVGIKRKWAPRLGFSPSFFRLASVLPPSFLSKFFKGPSDRLIPALCTYTFPPKPSKASTSFTYLPQFKHLRCSEPQSAAFYLCHHVERLTSKEQEKKGGVGGSGSDGELKEFHLARDEKHRLEKNLQRMRELLPQLPFFC